VRKFVKTLRKPGKTAPVINTLIANYPSAPLDSLNLIQSMLRFNPEVRPPVTQLLADPYMKRFYCPEDEPERTPLPRSDFEFERRVLTLESLREEIFRQVLFYHPAKQKDYLAKSRSYALEKLELFDPWDPITLTDDESG